MQNSEQQYEQYNAQYYSDALAHDQFKQSVAISISVTCLVSALVVVALSVFCRRRQHAAMRVRHRKRRDQRDDAHLPTFFATRCDRFVINNNSATLRFERSRAAASLQCGALRYATMQLRTLHRNSERVLRRNSKRVLRRNSERLLRLRRNKRNERYG